MQHKCAKKYWYTSNGFLFLYRYDADFITDWCLNMSFTIEYREIYTKIIYYQPSWYRDRRLRFLRNWVRWIVIHVYFTFFKIRYNYTRSQYIALYTALDAYKRITHGQTIAGNIRGKCRVTDSRGLVKSNCNWQKDSSRVQHHSTHTVYTSLNEFTLKNKLYVVSLLILLAPEFPPLMHVGKRRNLRYNLVNASSRT